MSAATLFILTVQSRDIVFKKPAFHTSLTQLTDTIPSRKKNLSAVKEQILSRDTLPPKIVVDSTVLSLKKID